MSSIVIIGAGAAGLSAAADLARAGLEVIVLEARERVGGRVYTLHESGSVIEMGAEFIHGLPPETWSIVKAAALETQEVKGDLRVRDQSGLLKKEKDARGEAVWKRLRAFDSADRSFDQFVAECVSDADLGKARVTATRYVESFHAADPASISALSLARIERATASISGERSFRLPAGYDSLISWMFDRATAEGASIQCGVIVERVRWRRGSVEIAALEKGSGSRRVYQASRLLVTLPLGVLKQEQGTEGAVLFEPALSSKKAALTGSSPSQTVRLSLKFRSKWWRERFRDLAFAFSPRESFPVWWTSEPLDRPVIVAWAGGAKAERLLQLADDAIIDQAIEGLAHLFEVKRQLLENEFERAFMHDWRADPFARGSYSYILAGSPDAAAQLAEPIDETLFFAGEATNSEGHSGTVHGAIATGKRAARELIASL